jgi:hypothetical protein
MGQVQDGLKDPLADHQPNLVDHKGYEDGQGKTNKDLPQADGNSIKQNLVKFRGSEQGFEVLKPGKGAFRNSPVDIVILESGNKAVHGHVAD